MFLLVALLAAAEAKRRRRPRSTNDILKITLPKSIAPDFEPVYVHPVRHKRHKSTKRDLIDLLGVLTQDKYQEENVHSPGERQLESILSNLRQHILPVGMLSNKGRQNRLKKRIIRAQSVKPLRIAGK